MATQLHESMNLITKHFQVEEIPPEKKIPKKPKPDKPEKPDDPKKPKPKGKPKAKIQKNKLPFAGNVKFSNTANMEECMNEMKAFVRGGMPALYQLSRVMPNIFKFYEVSKAKEQNSVMRQCGLKTVFDPFSKMPKMVLEENNPENCYTS